MEEVVLIDGGYRFETFVSLCFLTPHSCRLSADQRTTRQESDRPLVFLNSDARRDCAGNQNPVDAMMIPLTQMEYNISK